MRGAYLLILMGCLLGVPLSGCPVDPEGDVVGTYSVSGSLVENSCGSTAFAAQDPIDFVVELRAEDHGPAYWQSRARLPGRPCAGACRKCLPGACS